MISWGKVCGAEPQDLATASISGALSSVKIRAEVPDHDAGAAELGGVFTFALNGFGVFVDDDTAAGDALHVGHRGLFVPEISVFSGVQKSHRLGVGDVHAEAGAVDGEMIADVIDAESAGPEGHSHQEFGGWDFVIFDQVLHAFGNGEGWLG